MPVDRAHSRPRVFMYPNDTTLFDLGAAELLVVTVLRLWAAGCGDAAAPITWSAPFVRPG